MSTVTAPVVGVDDDGLSPPRRQFAIAVLLLTLVLIVLDGAIANVALPSMAASFGSDPADIVWVVSAYQLAVLVALLPCGAIGEIFGPRRVYLIGVAIFTLGSAACAVAGSLPVLVVARLGQGLGGGAIMALATMNMRHAVPQRMLGTIIGINAMTVAISSAAGPGIAGAILSVAHWSWLFAVNIPIGLVVLAIGRTLPYTEGSRRPLNGPALLVNALMFLLFFSGADRIADHPIIGALLIATSGVCLVGLLHLERGRAAPIVPTDLLADPAFRIAVIASVACFTAQMLSYVALPFHLQHTLNMPPARAGLYMMPWPAAVTVVAPIAGRLAEHVKTAWLCAAGAGLLALGLAIAGLTPPDPSGTTFVIATVIAGVGFGLFQTPNNRILLLSAPKARSGAAGAMQGTARLVGQTLGAISMSLVFAVVPFASATNVALCLAALCALIAGGVSLARARHETVG